MKELLQYLEKLENSIAAMQCQLTEISQNVDILQQDFDILQRSFEVISMACANSMETVPKVCQNCSKTTGNSTMETVEPLTVKRKGVERTSAKTVERAKTMPKHNFQPEKRGLLYNNSTPIGDAYNDYKKQKTKNTKIKGSSNKKKERIPPMKDVRKIIPPKVEWIQRYCDQRNNTVDPQQFFDFYESKGWLVGKVKMKDWQASVRTWEKNNKYQIKVKPPIYDDGIKYIWDAKIQKYRHSISGTIYIP